MWYIQVRARWAGTACLLAMHLGPGGLDQLESSREPATRTWRGRLLAWQDQIRDPRCRSSKAAWPATEAAPLPSSPASRLPLIGEKEHSLASHALRAPRR